MVVRMCETSALHEPAGRARFGLAVAENVAHTQAMLHQAVRQAI